MDRLYIPVIMLHLSIVAKNILLQRSRVEEQAPKPVVGWCVSSWWPSFPSRNSVLSSISSFFVVLLYVLIHHIIFWLSLYFLNILYFLYFLLLFMLLDPVVFGTHKDVIIIFWMNLSKCLKYCVISWCRFQRLKLPQNRKHSRLLFRLWESMPFTW